MKLRPGPRLVFDLETTALPNITKVHLLVIKDVDTREVFVFRNNANEDTILEGIAMLNGAELLIAHNGVGFDLPVLWDLYGDDFNPQGVVRDTLVMARMYFSDEKERDFRRHKRGELDGKLIGRHELKAWGQRLGVHKGDYAEKRAEELKEEFPELALPENKQRLIDMVWGTWSQGMEDYAVQDVEVTYLLWLKISAKPFPDFAILLEHEVHALMERVQKNGFPFDTEAANKLADELREAHREKSVLAKKHFGSWWVPSKWKRVNEATTYCLPATGNVEKNLASFQPRSEFGEDDTREHWGEVMVPKRTVRFKEVTKGDTEAGCAYCPVELKEFNPNSRQQIVDRLTKIYNWVPQEFTEKGSPSVNDEILRDLSITVPICDELAEIFYYKKRLGQLADGEQALIDKALERGDGRIHPRITVGGTVTNRASHSNPNVAQVPRVVFKLLLQWEEADAVHSFAKGKIVYGRNVNGEFVEGGLTALLDPDTGKQFVGVPVKDKETGDYVRDETGKIKTKKTLLKGRAGDHGWDFRNLFGVPKGWKLLGADQKGIELRALGHYMSAFDGGEYLKLVIDPFNDIHEYHQKVMELDSRDTAKTAIYACVPLDTLVLTRRGWTKHDELIVGEDIMSYNAERNVKEWTPLLEVVNYDDAPLLEIGNSHSTFRVRCTPNHRWFVNRRTGKRNRYYVPEVRTAEDLNSECNIIMNAPMAPEQDIANGVPNTLLTTEKYGINWEAIVLGYSQAQRESFLAGFLIADGHYVKWKEKGTWNFNQNRGPLAESAIIASFLVSQNSIAINEYINRTSKNPANHKAMVAVRLRNSPHATMQRMTRVAIDNAPVFCVRTKNESFVMRQGDVITITGNTIYGAQDYKLGITVDPTLVLQEHKARAIGREMRTRLMTRISAFGQLSKSVQRLARRGYVDALDGRPLYVRGQHSALNTLLQGAAATVSKLWCVIFEQLCEEDGLVHGWDGDFVFMAWIHDEIQTAVRDDPRVMVIVEKNIKEAAAIAAERLKFHSPVDIGTQWGDRWSESH